MSDGRQLGEAVVVIAAVVAVLLSAAFLPAVDVFGGGGGELGVGGGLGSTGDSGNGGGSGGDAAGGTSGSPVGGSLTTPETASISGGRESSDPLAPVPLFVVDSPENAYWRQTAFTSYTGTGWERSATTRPITEGVPNDDRTVDSRTIEYDVTVLSSAQSLPTIWQPETVSLQNQSEPTVLASSVGGISTDRSVAAESTYVAESSLPPSDPDMLREATGRAPAGLRETYTQLPADTPERVTTFSSDLIAEEETRYDRVMAVQNWLQSNKGYSLQTPIDSTQPIADQLLFEVDEGYCQHFATTMAVMLRSQDIPARYVVGFAGGKAVGDGEYLVTSDRGHAWVEVYFDEVGWIRFDPTPGGELPVDSPQPPYEISLNRSAVVGASVSVNVEKNDSAVVGVPVYINNERVGWTDGGGDLDTALPYAENITITARPAGSETKYTDGSTSPTSAADPEDVASTTTVRTIEDVVSATIPHTISVSAGASNDLGSVYQIGRSAVGALGTLVFQTEGTEKTNNESSVTYTPETNATVSVGGNRTAGTSARVVATIRDVPVTDATVTFDGQPVGATNSKGAYTLSLADVQPGTYQVTVSREPVAVSTMVTVKPPEANSSSANESEQRDPLAPNVSVSPTLIALPGGPATATVSRDGQPISGAPVRVNETVVGQTDGNGTVSFSFPITGTAVVATSVNGVSGEQRVNGLFRNAGGVFVVLIGVVTGLVALARRYGITRQVIRDTLAMVLRRCARLPNQLTTLVIRLATGIEAAIAKLWRGIQSLPRLLSSSVLSVVARLNPLGLLLAVVRWVQSQFRGLRRSDATATTQSTNAAPANTEEHQELQAIWSAFVAVVRPPKLRTWTPAEIGRYATDKGLPRRPVESLTNLYRAIRYGRRSPDDSRLETAREALSTIQNQEDDE